MDVESLIEQWRLYAKANRAAANENKSKGDSFGADEAAIRYTKARTWQDCAKAIDPGLPEVQPKLSE